MTTPNDTSNMIEFRLTKGSICHIDEQDSDLLQYKWSELERSTTYAKSTKRIDGKQRLLHCMILSRILKCDLKRGELVDHIDGNGLNCTRDNLRLATPVQNGANSRIGSSNTSGFKGVHQLKRNGRFEAKIRQSGKLKHLGCFGTAEEAYEVYKKAAIEAWGEFANV